MAEFTHFNENGQAHMVDVGAKDRTHRIAIASGRIHMHKDTFQMVAQGNSKKGDVIGIARVAAIMASKKTADLIPLCHPISLTRVNVDFRLEENSSSIRCVVCCECHGKTGVEMEALTSVQVGLLTIYDMCKAVDRGMVITDIGLDEKRGGKSGTWQRMHIEK